MRKLDGQVALITGGARGQGRSHARLLAENGADIAVCDITSNIETIPYELGTSEELEETGQMVRDLGRKCLTIKADVRDTEQVKSAVARTCEEFGKIDILVANAGVVGFGAFWEITDQMWDDMISVDLTGAFKVMRATVPHMIDTGYGRIVATSSMGGRFGNPNLAHYVAAKWGLIGMVKTLALEVADKGITVNAICPATVDTPMVQNSRTYSLFSPDQDNPTRADVEDKYRALNQIPIPWVQPEDVSAAVLYLVTNSSRYVTGSTLDVGAGATALMP